MRRIVGDKIVRCELNGERSHERLIGVCLLPDGTDIGAEIIRRGPALDCPHFSGSKYRALGAQRCARNYSTSAVLPGLMSISRSADGSSNRAAIQGIGAASPPSDG